jgi:hypothetical protein
MHYLSSIYFVNQPHHVSAMFIAHHKEVFTVYVQQLVRVKCLSWLGAGPVRMELLNLAGPAASQLHLTRTNCCVLMMGNKHSRNMRKLIYGINL